MNWRILIPAGFAAWFLFGMAQLAEAFSRTLVVEGVETAAQLEQLQALGCRMVQGYLLCRPAPLAQLPNQPLWPQG